MLIVKIWKELTKILIHDVVVDKKIKMRFDKLYYIK